MRILIDYRPALRQRTGVGEYVHALAAALLRTRPAGSAEHVTLFSSSWKDRLHGPLPGDVLIDRRIPVRLLNLLWHRCGWPPVERVTGRRFDVVHSPHPLLLPAAPSAARLVTIHDLHFLARPDLTRGEIRRDYPGRVRRHAGQADAVVVSSRYTAGRVAQALGIPAHRIALCPPGAPDWTPRRSVPSNGYILFMGTLEPRKNVGTLLEACRRLFARRPELPPLRLAGKPAPDARRWLAMARTPPLAGRVSHLGYVPEADRRGLYEGARLLVLPSLEEGFGLPVLEAFSAGVPVVASNRGALPELIGDAGLMVEPEDADGLAAAIERVLDDEMQCATMVARGAARARQFTWEAAARAIRAAYEAAVDEARARTDAHRD